MPSEFTEDDEKFLSDIMDRGLELDRARLNGDLSPLLRVNTLPRLRDLPLFDGEDGWAKSSCGATSMARPLVELLALERDQKPVLAASVSSGADALVVPFLMNSRLTWASRDLILARIFSGMSRATSTASNAASSSGPVRLSLLGLACCAPSLLLYIATAVLTLEGDAGIWLTWDSIGFVGE